MDDASDTYPFSIDCGEKRGEIIISSPHDALEFVKSTLPNLLSENDLLTAENAELRKRIDKLKSEIPKKETPIALNPTSVAFVRRPNDRKAPTKIGELWDEDHVKRLDTNATFDLSFPRGRYVTGFVGTLTLSYGSLTTLKSSLLWHDFYIDIKEDEFWRGKIIVQRRTDDDKYNIRSLGINEYVGR